jgi:hypothetical protein
MLRHQYGKSWERPAAALPCGRPLSYWPRSPTESEHSIDMDSLAGLCGHSPQQTGELLDRLVATGILSAWHHSQKTDEIFWHLPQPQARTPACMPPRCHYRPQLRGQRQAKDTIRRERSAPPVRTISTPRHLVAHAVPSPAAETSPKTGITPQHASNAEERSAPCPRQRLQPLNWHRSTSPR